MTTYALGIVANPYSTICLVTLGDDGKPEQTRLKAWTGKWDDNGRPVYRGHKICASTYNVHQSGGFFSPLLTEVAIVDETPRSFEDACAIASKCPPGNHIDRQHMTVEQAKSHIEQATMELAR
jgi:hypothetical protein